VEKKTYRHHPRTEKGIRPCFEKPKKTEEPRRGRRNIKWTANRDSQTREGGMLKTVKEGRKKKKVWEEMITKKKKANNWGNKS